MYRNENFDKIRNIQKDLYAYKESKVGCNFFVEFADPSLKPFLPFD